MLTLDDDFFYIDAELDIATLADALDLGINELFLIDDRSLHTGQIRLLCIDLYTLNMFF